MVKIHFSDFFEVSPDLLEEHGAFNVSLVSDLPLFIDPFLLFNSDNPVYQRLHDDIIRYVRFLRDHSATGSLDPGLMSAWYRFSEVKQTWLGYSKAGNRGSGLGPKFAMALHANLNSVFANFGDEGVTHGSHLEKLCLIADGVGRDNISDFTTNLIKGYLLEYTQQFTIIHIRPELRKRVPVQRARFNYETQSWVCQTYDLPFYRGSGTSGDYVLLTPKDMLTRDEIWISKSGLFHDFDEVAASIPNDQLRSQLNNHFRRQLNPDADKKEIDRAVAAMIREFPEILDYYIRQREDSGDRAVSISSQKVDQTAEVFVRQLIEFVSSRLDGTEFYDLSGDTYAEARDRLLFLKHVIESGDGYRLFYFDGRPITREKDVQLLYRLTWFATPSDVNREPNNGRGPVDFKVSRGSADTSLVEFKLASNTQLKRNLEKQVQIYQEANQTDKALKAIVYFSTKELKRVTDILSDLGLTGHPDIVLIDARADNKPSASKA